MDADTRKAGLAAGAEIGRLRTLDEAAGLERHALLAALQRQLQPVADQRLARQQRVIRAGMRLPERPDQPQPRPVPPSEDTALAQQLGIGERGKGYAIILPGNPTELGFERLEAQPGLGEEMAEIEDRIVRFLPVDTPER